SSEDSLSEKHQRAVKDSLSAKPQRATSDVFKSMTFLRKSKITLRQTRQLGCKSAGMEGIR
ncbi:hypothetical protein Tco_1118420, partial [Tanacetum coccineum]